MTTIQVPVDGAADRRGAWCVVRGAWRATPARGPLAAPFFALRYRYFLEGGDEPFHLGLSPDRHPHEIRQRGKESADLNFSIFEGGDQRFHFTPHIDHHEIRVRRNVVELQFVQLTTSVLPYFRIFPQSVRN